MKVQVERYFGRVQEFELTYALEPREEFNDGGAVEQAQSKAKCTAEAFGRLAALLVEKEVITLDEAVKCSGNYLPGIKVVESKSPGAAEPPKNPQSLGN